MRRERKRVIIIFLTKGMLILFLVLLLVSIFGLKVESSKFMTRISLAKKIPALFICCTSFCCNAADYAKFNVGSERNTLPENEIVPSQLAKSDKVDINNAQISDYKKFPGMYPHAAGQIHHLSIYF